MIRRLFRCAVPALCVAVCFAADAAAQQQPKPYGGGTPLDTIMNTHIWADVPEPKDFVRETRPPASSLDYRPLTGTDPERPKPRSPTEVQALQAELEAAGAKNERRAGRVPKVAPKTTAARAPTPVQPRP